VGAGLRVLSKILRVAELAIYTSLYGVATFPKLRIGKINRRTGVRGHVQQDGQGHGGRGGGYAESQRIGHPEEDAAGIPSSIKG
jgi:hypothetical protein